MGVWSWNAHSSKYPQVLKRHTMSEIPMHPNLVGIMMTYVLQQTHTYKHLHISWCKHIPLAGNWWKFHGIHIAFKPWMKIIWGSWSFGHWLFRTPRPTKTCLTVQFIAPRYSRCLASSGNKVEVCHPGMRWTQWNDCGSHSMMMPFTFWNQVGTSTLNVIALLLQVSYNPHTWEATKMLAQ